MNAGVKAAGGNAQLSVPLLCALPGAAFQADPGAAFGNGAARHGKHATRNRR